MSNYVGHIKFAGWTLFVILVYCYFVDPEGSPLLGVAVLGYVFGMFVFNPDTFTASKSHNNLGIAKKVFQNRLWSFAHHGLSHNPLFWGALSAVSFAYDHFFPYTVSTVVYTNIIFFDVSYYASVFVLGVSINAGVHLVCDALSLMKNNFTNFN